MPAIVIRLLLAALFMINPVIAANLTLRYDQPAARWEQEALPIGNGYLGAMLFGGVATDQIQFNEESLWIGDETDTGAYQAFGDVWVRIGAAAAQPATPSSAVPTTGYRRELDLARAVHTVGYKQDGVTYRREAFASYPAKVLVFRYTADKPGALTGAVELTDTHKASINAAGDTITATGSLADFTFKGGSAGKVPKTGYAFALNYEARARVLHEGGTLTVQGNQIAFADVTTLTLILSAGTDFVQDRAKGWKDPAQLDKVAARLQAASARTWDALLAEHLRDYQGLFGRVTLDLGTSCLLYTSDAADE